MRELILSDFRVRRYDDVTSIGRSSYYLYKDLNIEIYLEPCLNGFDVAIYDTSNEELIRPKVCTDLTKIPQALRKALVIANLFYKEYYLKRVGVVDYSVDEILSNKQSTVLDILKVFIQTHNRSPSVRELQRLCGHKNVRSTQQFLDILESKGYINITGEYNGIVITK